MALIRGRFRLPRLRTYVPDDSCGVVRPGLLDLLGMDSLPNPIGQIPFQDLDMRIHGRALTTSDFIQHFSHRFSGHCHS